MISYIRGGSLRRWSLFIPAHIRSSFPFTLSIFIFAYYMRRTGTTRVAASSIYIRITISIYEYIYVLLQLCPCLPLIIDSFTAYTNASLHHFFRARPRQVAYWKFMRYIFSSPVYNTIHTIHSDSNTAIYFGIWYDLMQGVLYILCSFQNIVACGIVRLLSLTNESKVCGRQHDGLFGRCHSI